MPPLTEQETKLWLSLEDLPSPRARPMHTALLSNLVSETNRREFLKRMGASLALAGMTSCVKMPSEKIYPYATNQERYLETETLYFASSALFNGYAKGIVVESHQGRPTKIEGNLLHPASLGTTDIFMQAEILSLYDP